MKSSRMTTPDKAMRKAAIDARRIKHTIPARPLAASDLLIGDGYFGGGKYIPAGRLRNVPPTNR